MNEAIAAPKVKKRRVRGLVIILLARSALTLTTSYYTINLINQAPERYWWWALPLYYFHTAIGVALLVAAVMLPLYKQPGLVLGVGAIIIEAVVTVIQFAIGRFQHPLDLVLSTLTLCVFFISLRAYLKNESKIHA